MRRAVWRSRLDVLREGVRELWVHPRSPAHAVGFVERHIFKCDGRGRWATGEVSCVSAGCTTNRAWRTRP
jgi:hypothetical protein